MIMMIYDGMRLALWFILFVLIGYVAYDIITTSRVKRKLKEVNGVKLGDVFKLICEIDECTRLYLDTQTSFMYLMCDTGITPVLDSKGKPRKYSEFLSSINGKEVNNEQE